MRDPPWEGMESPAAFGSSLDASLGWTTGDELGTRDSESNVPHREGTSDSVGLAAALKLPRRESCGRASHIVSVLGESQRGSPSPCSRLSPWLRLPGGDFQGADQQASCQAGRSRHSSFLPSHEHVFKNHAAGLGRLQQRNRCTGDTGESCRRCAEGHADRGGKEGRMK